MQNQLSLSQSVMLRVGAYVAQLGGYTTADDRLRIQRDVIGYLAQHGQTLGPNGVTLIDAAISVAQDHVHEMRESKTEPMLRLPQMSDQTAVRKIFGRKKVR